MALFTAGFDRFGATRRQKQAGEGSSLSDWLLRPHRHVLLSLCLFYAIRAEMMQGRVKTKEMSQLVLNTTTGLPLSSTFCIILLSNLSLYFTSTCRIGVVASRHGCETSCLHRFLSRDSLLCIFRLLGQEDECRAEGLHQAHPPERWLKETR